MSLTSLSRSQNVWSSATIALARWRNLAPQARSVIWLVASGVTLAAMSVVIRICAVTVHPLEIVFLRNFLGMLFLAPFLFHRGRIGLQTGRIGFYWLRACLSLISIVTWFYAVTLMPLSTATAINFTTPLFATVAAAALLGEKVTLTRIISLLVGFAGVLVVAQPGQASIADVSVILLSAAASGLSLVTVKSLCRTESPGTIVAYLTLFLTPLSLVPALFVWTWPSAALWGWLGLLAGLAALAQLCATRAYALADAGFLAPFEFVRLIFAVLFGYMFFAETTGTTTWLGASLIVVAAAWALRPARPT